MSVGSRPITQTIALPMDVAQALLRPALARRVSAGALALRIVETVVRDGMIGAVLDDGVDHLADDLAGVGGALGGGGR